MSYTKLVKALDKPLFQKVTSQVNDRMLLLVKELQDDNSIGEFDQSMRCSDISTVNSVLVRHRIVKKFSRPGGREAVTNCFRNYLEFDQSLASRKPIDLWKERGISYALRKARSSVLSSVKRAGTFDLFLHSDPLQRDPIFVESLFSGGSTFLSAPDGELSLVARLNDRNHWTCTSEVVDVTCNMVYNCRQLKLFAKQHIGFVSKDERKRLYLKHKHSGHLGFNVFSDLLTSRVLIVTAGSRSASVKKNVETDRFINIEPMFNMLIQRAFASYLKKICGLLGNPLSVKRFESVNPHTGKQTNHTWENQKLHGLLISDMDNVTIDFKNASDSTLIDSVYKILGSHIGDIATLIRSPRVLLGNWFYPVNKMSSMGNGFTFELMTLLITAVSKQFDIRSRVFGDDLIVHSDVCHEVIAVLRRIGYNVNEKKTFLTGFFRESCGYFYYDNGRVNGYLTSFDFTWCESYNDAIGIANKLSIILKEAYLLPSLEEKLKSAHADIIAYFGLLSKGPYPTYLNTRRNLHCYVYVDTNCARGKLHKPAIRTLAQLCIERYKELYGVQPERFQVCFSQVWVPTVTKWRSKNDRYISALMGQKIGVCRGKGRWYVVPLLVNDSGSYMFARNLFRKNPLLNVGYDGKIDPRV